MKIRTLRSPCIQSDRIVIGVDIAKSTCVAVAQTGDGQVSKPLKFGTSRSGFEKLRTFALSMVEAKRATDFVVALEPTGHYGVPLVKWLEGQGIEVMRVEALHTNRFKELVDGTRRKTDAKDAAAIAMLCRQGTYRPYRLLTGVYADLRVLSRRREQLVKQRSQATNRLHRHLDEVFPELPKLFDRMGPTLLALLEEASSPKAILDMPVGELATHLRAASRGNLGLERAHEIREAADMSVGSSIAAEAHRLAIRQLVEDSSHLHGQIGEVEREMKARLAQVPYADDLLSIPRLGVITLATLLGEFGDLRDFDRAAKLIKHAGLDLVESSSGARKGKRHISRRGRRYARQMLFLAALRMGGAFALARARLLARDKEPMVAAVANMCRLLRVMHAIVREGVPYDPAHGQPTPEAALAA